MPKHNVLPVREGDSHSKNKGDILFPEIYQSEATQDLRTGGIYQTQSDIALVLGKPLVLAEQEEEMP